MNHKIYSNKTFQLKAKDIALDAIFNLFPVNFCWMDEKGYVLGCNQTLIDCFNINSFKDIIGKHTTEIASDTAWSNTQKVLASGESFVGEEIHLDKNFNTIYFLSMKHPMKDCGGDVIGVVNIAFDITERKTMEMNLRELKEAAELADKVKTEFLVNMRHDLKTPLSGIVTISEFLQNTESESTKKNYLQDIKQCAESMLSHLNEIIDHVKAESGEFSIVEREFDIHTILKDIYQMMLPMATSKQLDFTFSLDHIPPIFIGDVARTERILLNIISNAIKFTEGGHVRIFINWCQVSNDKGILEFIIDDSGIGIPEDKKDIIFEKFQRLNPSYEGVYTGNGLGLHIVKRFIQDLNGEYELISFLGKGTIFKVRLPYKVPTIKMRYGESSSKTEIHFQAQSLLKTPPPPIPTFDKKHKILLVEDNQIISRISKEILEKLNLEVDVAENGKKALEFAGKYFYDLILMDIGLPDMDGYKVTRHLRSCNITTPIIAITAHTESEERNLAIEAGMNEMFSKPLTQEMAEAIKAQLS